MLKLFLFLCFGFCCLVHGQVHPRQFRRIFRKYGCDMVVEIAREIKSDVNFTFRLLDHSPKDERVTWTEVKRKLTQLNMSTEKDVHNKFLLSDVDGSESLDIDEYAKGAVFSYSLWMMDADKEGNRNGQFEYEEFTNLIKKFRRFAYKTISKKEQLHQISLCHPGPQGYTVLDLTRVDTALFEKYAREILVAREH